MTMQPEDSDIIQYFLAHLSIVEPLNPITIESLASALQKRNFELGETIVEEGVAYEGLYMIYKGRAYAQAKKSNAIMSHLEEGDYFGTPTHCVVRLPVIARADVVAAIDSICLFLPMSHYPFLKIAMFKSKPSSKLSQNAMETILTLETLEVDLTRGFTPPESNLYKRVFGGQLLGQALVTASRSVDPSLKIHSLHSYFLIAGDPKVPIVYHVEHIRDGHSFATRHVIANQKGRSIFSMHASYQKVESGLEHQSSMPAVCPDPTSVPSWEELQQNNCFDPRIPMKYRRSKMSASLLSMPVDMRFCDPVDWVDPKKRDPSQLIWVKVKGQLSDDPAMHNGALAYASDFSFLETSLFPHGVRATSPNLVMASLDHCIWFHRPFRADDWLLYQVESPQSSGSRGFCLGRFFTQSGELVASVAQEGLIRVGSGQEKGPSGAVNKAKL